MDALYAIGEALILIFVLELGDKTQLMTISFASKYSRRAVFIGVFCALSVVTVLGVVIGYVLHAALPVSLIQGIAAAVFIILGIWIILRREEEQKIETEEIPEKRVFLNTFLLTALAELGDKTQIAVILLSAESGLPLAVLTGALIGFLLIVAIGVIIGREISKRVSRKWIVLASGIVFILIGIITIVEMFL